MLAGHVDTVPIADNVPSRLDEDGVLWGCGTSDMKSGVAVQLRIAATVPEPNRDLTFVFYDNEEVAADLNGLGKIAAAHPEWLEGDFAVLLEPSDGQVEGGCQGTLRVVLHTAGERAHSARSWMGSNAVHAAAPILARLAAYEPRKPVIDGLEYHEGLNAVAIEGGVATNVIPDACAVTVNYRYAPDRSPAEALAHVREVFADCDVAELVVDDESPGALPGLSHPAAEAFMKAVGGSAPQVRLDRRLPLQRPRGPRRQLRARRSHVRAQAGRARRRRADPPLRGPAPRLADCPTSVISRFVTCVVLP